MLLVAGVGVESYRSLLASRERASKVAHTHQVLETLAAIVATLQDAESGQRGLLITEDARHLQRYEGSLAALDERSQELRLFVADNPLQTRRAVALVGLANARAALLREGLRIYRASGIEEARRFIKGDQGPLAMERVRSAEQEMEAEERRLLTSRAVEAEAAHRRTLGVVTAVSRYDRFGVPGR